MEALPVTVVAYTGTIDLNFNEVYYLTIYKDISRVYGFIQSKGITVLDEFDPIKGFM
jgi:hypothetical protein